MTSRTCSRAALDPLARAGAGGRTGLCLLLLLGACAHQGSRPVDLVTLVELPARRPSGPSLGAILVRIHADTRPMEERGTSEYLGRSYVGDQDFSEPTDVGLLKVLARDLVAAGVASAAGLEDTGQPLTLDMEILHAGASFGSGLETLILLPTSEVQARCNLRLLLRDRAGRILLDAPFDSRLTSQASVIGGLRSSASRRLAEAIRETLDAALPVIATAPALFWERLGRAPR